MPATRQRLFRLTLGGLVVALGLAVAWVAVAGVRARTELLAAETDLRAARQALGAGEIGRAQEHLRQASTATRAADERLRAPPVRGFAAIPGVGNSLEAASDLTTTARGVTDETLEVLDALQALPGGLDALRPSGGKLPTAALRALASPLRALDARVSEAATTLRSGPRTMLLPAVSDARDRFRTMLDELGHHINTAADLATQLPEFLGTEGTRRYFLAVANPAELRATGGFIGAYATVTIDDGRLTVGGFGPTWDLPSLGSADAPSTTADFEARYGQYNASGLWANINMSPDFPTVGTAIERLWAATTADTRVDGTILVDPFALEALIRITGPVEVPETGVTLRPARVVDYVTHESFAELEDARERKEVIGDVAAASLAAFLDGAGDADVGRMLDLLGGAVAGRHLVLHAADADEQAAFVRAGLAGPLPDPDRGVFTAVSYNSGTASKVDYWLEESLAHRVRLLEDGRAQVTTTLRLHNGAPTTGVRRVVGPNTPDLEAGDNRLMVSHYCGSRCDVRSASGDDGETVQTTTELGGTVASGWTRIPAGGDATFTFTATVEDAWWVHDGELVLTVAHHDQTMVREGTLELVVDVPEGFRVAATPDEAEVTDGQVRWSRTGRGDVTLRIVLAAATPADDR